MMESNMIKNVLYLLGHKNGKNSPRFIIFTIIIITMSTGTIIKMYKVWNTDVIKRFITIKDYIATITILMICLEILFVPDHIWSLIKMIDKDFFKEEIIDNCLKIKLTNQKINAITNNKISQNFYLKTTNCVIALIVTALIIIPCLIIIYISFIKNYENHIDFQKLPLPIECWIPEKFNKSLFMFILIYVFSATSLILTGMYGSIALAVFLVSTGFMILDLKLYCISLKEINKYVIINRVNEDRYNSFESDNYVESKLFKRKIDSRKLKLYTKYLITQHNIICRNMGNVIKFVQISITAANQSLCLEICTFLFLSIEIHNNGIKVVCLCSALLQCVIFYFYCQNGQNLIDEYDEVRRCLGECSWIDKPHWFKQMLITMMIRSTAPFQIKPFGLYVINLRNFIHVLKVSYSYLNFLRTLK